MQKVTLSKFSVKNSSPRVKAGLAFVFTLGITLISNWFHPFGAPLPAIGSFFDPARGFWQNAEALGAMGNQSLEFPVQGQQVSILLDDRLVPHIFAENEKDAAFAQGYITAQHRLWQMDIATRSVSGRLSEILGERTLKRDKLQRRKGLVFAAERALEAWKKTPDEMAIIEAYTEGINTWVASLKPEQYPLEFKLLGYAPEPWTPLKTSLMLKNMAETLCSRSDDIAASNSMELFGEELFRFLYPEYNPKQSPIIPTEVSWIFKPVFKPEPQPQLSGLIPFRNIPQQPEGIGSNNWALSGSKTASGNPILCNDPHLRLTLPSIWYEVQIHTPELNAYGVSLPGVPGIVIGFNENIAWGLTNVGQDVLDWYRIRWADASKSSYLLDGASKLVEFREEVIRVRGRKEPVTDQVKYTVWGPVVHETTPSEYIDMAMRWVAHDTPSDECPHEVGLFFGLMKAKDYTDYNAAVSCHESPAQNIVFASRGGDIAITVAGKFPIKQQEQGRFVQDGSLSANAWQGFIPADQIPKVLNPNRGFVASANQRSTGLDYPYYYNGGFDDYRGRYINRRIEAMKGATAEDMMALQNDNYSIKAEEGVPLLLRLLDESQVKDPLGQQILADLKSWNFRFEGSSKAPAAFEVWFRATNRRAFEDLFDFEIRDSMEVLFPETWRLLELLEQQPEHAVFDDYCTNQNETAREIVTTAFGEMVETLREKYTTNNFDWAKQKGTNISHLANIPAFSANDVQCGGYYEAPNAISKANGPSWRMIVELGDSPKAHGVYPGGQSGNPGSPFYDNSVADWAAGRYYDLLFMKDVNDGRDKIHGRVEIKSK